MIPLQITEYAEAANSDLIVMGTNGRGAVAPLLVGLVAERSCARRGARC